LDALPVDGHLPAIRDALRAHRAVVVTAAPGAGKTTRVPPALVEDGPVIVLEPRRVAARAIARRIADERGWTIGREIGWHVRFDRQFSDDTRLLVATEGILTAELQQDPLASRWRTIVLDEFHERSLYADVGLALARQAWLARTDLRLVVMSATMDSARVAAFLGGCPIIEAPGRVHPVAISHRPGIEPDEAIADAWPRAAGSLLCFLPGVGEIRRTAERVASRLRGVDVLPLHGSLTPDDQDAAIRLGPRRIILATNVAETSVTVPGVTCVVDAGWHKVARYDPARAIDSLDLERISQDSADQRAGRAGRTAPGTAIRLWDSRDRLRVHREAEIARVDLSATVLDVIAWGGEPRTFEWFDAPAPHAIDSALELLHRLNAIGADGRLTAGGRAMQRMPLAPRLSRILLAAHGAPVAARACALLAERSATVPRHQATSCDLLAAVEHPRDLPPHVVAVARDLEASAKRALGGSMRASISDEDFRRAVLAGYPDRVARRRSLKGDSLLLASGSGARLARESGVINAEFLVAVEMRGEVGPAAEPLVRVATAIDKDWLDATADEVVHVFDEEAGVVRARRLGKYGALVVKERHVAPDADEAARLVADAYVRRGPRESDGQLLHRLAFAGLPTDFEARVRAAAVGAVRLADVNLESALPHDEQRRLARDAPSRIQLANGTEVRLEYRGDGRPIASIKLQKVMGVSSAPTLGPRRVPITFELLAPNGRPVQVTSDLASFWTKVYPEIRGPLKARYPKHRW
jgi:ATP-dependent helicase HrpB